MGRASVPRYPFLSLGAQTPDKLPRNSFDFYTNEYEYHGLDHQGAYGYIGLLDHSADITGSTELMMMSLGFRVQVYCNTLIMSSNTNEL